jgi:hypothetical protein
VTAAPEWNLPIEERPTPPATLCERLVGDAP